MDLTYFNNSIDEGSAIVSTTVELAISIQTTPQRLMQTLKDINLDDISSPGSQPTINETSVSNTVDHCQVKTGKNSYYARSKFFKNQHQMVWKIWIKL